MTPKGKDRQAVSLFRHLLKSIGENPDREGLLETPSRMMKSYRHIFGGYGEDPAKILKCFKEGSCDEMVILKNCEFYSTCEHHFLPFFGTVSIAYIPDGRVVGISKLARLVDCFARRLQIQERMTSQIADCIQDTLNAKGVYVVCEAEHLCMKSRGVAKQKTSMVTSAIRGMFERPEARAEFLSLLSYTAGKAHG